MKPNKPVKLTINGRRQGYIDLHRTAWGRFKFKVKTFFRKVFIYSMIGVAIWIIFALGGLFNPSTVYTKAEIIKEVQVKAPILDRIALCESPTGHWKNGQVVVNINKNGTYDMGKYQINSIWNKKATELGFNLAIEKDQDSFAKWLYSTRGTEDWYSSKSCWQK